MPLADTELAEAYGDRLELVARTSAVAAVRTWRPEGLWISAAGAAIRGGQSLAIALAREHARLMLERAGSAAEIPDARAEALGKLSSGMILERALAAVAVNVAAAAPADRAQVARTAIARIAHTAAYDASREELHTLIAAGPWSGWRWLSRGTCAACLARDDGSDRPDGSAMRVHPSCRCVPEPLLPGRERAPRLTGLERFARMSLEEKAAAIGAEAAAEVEAGRVTLAELVAVDTIHGERVITQKPLEEV